MKKAFLFIVGFYLIVIGLLGIFGILTPVIMWFDIVNIILGVLAVLSGFMKNK